MLRDGRERIKRKEEKWKKMAKNKNKRLFGVGIGVIAATGLFTIAILLAFAALSSGGGAAIEQNAEGNGGEATIAASAATTSINYQGRLTDSAGNLLNGTYTMTFKLYEVASGGTALATYTNRVEVTDGLFNTNIDLDQSYFDGSTLARDNSWIRFRDDTKTGTPAGALCLPCRRCRDPRRDGFCCFRHQERTEQARSHQH